MTSVRRWFALALVGLFLLGTAQMAQAQAVRKWEPGIRMQDALVPHLAAVRKVSDKTRYGYDGGVSLLAAFIHEKAHASFKRQFVRGERYLIFGSGERQVRDLDIEVLDAFGKVVVSDTKTDPTAVVEFNPPATGMYTLRLRLYSSPRPAFCAMSILREGGFDVPIRNLGEAADGLLNACERFDRSRKEQVSFADLSNQWALYGSVLRGGEDYTITGLSLGKGPRALIAAGDSTSSDVDVYVNDELGTQIHSDTRVDRDPTLVFPARFRPSHGIRIRNVSARGPTLVLSTVLQVH